MSNSTGRALVRRLYQGAAFLTAERVRVQGWSMYPTLEPWEWVLFDRLAYRVVEPATGDVVLALDPRDGRRLIKRIGAETDGGYWLLGDNPEQSTDSREFGPVGRAAIQARAWMVYWPVEGFRYL